MNRKAPIDYSYRIGEVYGRLQLTGYSVMQEYNGYRRRFVEAACECGHVDIYSFDSIQRGHTKSCGCLQKDLLRLHPNAKTHGLTKHPLFKIWDGIKGRCYDPKHTSYPRYGAKGTKMCDEWKNSFKKFYDWAVSNGWKKGLTIDRIKNHLGYEPENCRWASTRAQRMNRDDLNLITAFGETKCMLDWTLDKRCMVTYGGLRNRVGRDKKDWPDVEKAITTPPQIRGKTIKYKPENRMILAFGEEKSMADWLKDSRCVPNETVLRRRINTPDRWTTELAITTRVRKSRAI